MTNRGELKVESLRLQHKKYLTYFQAILAIGLATIASTIFNFEISAGFGIGNLLVGLIIIVLGWWVYSPKLDKIEKRVERLDKST